MAATTNVPYKKAREREGRWSLLVLLLLTSRDESDPDEA